MHSTSPDPVPTHSTLSYFHRALLLTLASLPACGGVTESPGTQDGGSTPPDANVDDASSTPDSGLPSTPCNWTPLPVVCGGCDPGCQWEFSFQGSALGCAGFSPSGTPAQCAAVCGNDSHGEPADSCSITPSATGGTLTCVVTTGPYCTPTLNGGRRPGYFASLGFGPSPRGRELGVHFARAACMEAGSVEAFRMLRDELVAHGAPKRLVHAAARAMRDEVRHVRQTSALARRFGEQPVTPRPVPPRPHRSFEAVALENAVEGCVRETYSALECAWQAAVATDPVVRATMKRIARDEMRHLALSWAVHAWALGRLDAASRARVIAAQRAEIATLLAELAQDPPASLLGTGGLPRAAQSRALVGAIAERLAA
jgi:hypothetical protein